MYSAFGENHSVHSLAMAVGWFRDSGQKYGVRLPHDIPKDAFIQASKYADYLPQLPPVSDWDAAWRSLPVVDILKRLGAPPTDFEKFLTSGPDDPFFADRGYVTDADRFITPVLHVNSWFDYGISSTLFALNRFAENADSVAARRGQYAIVSPTAHCTSESIGAPSIVGARDFGDARYDYPRLYLDWFDYWLKGVQNKVLARPKVQYYLTGRNTWAKSREWPPPGVQIHSLYLTGDGHTRAASGEGRLATRPPLQEGKDSFTYDPANPFPTLGGNACCWPGDTGNGAGSYNQAAREDRPDTLIYSGNPLVRATIIAGRPEVELFISSSARDTDFFVRLEDVDPQGHSYNVTESIVRARHREGLNRAVFMDPSQIYKLTIRMPDTAIEFGRGHRIRLMVTSSNFPAYTRNLNTGGDNFTQTTWVVAENAVHHSRRWPSQLRLPVLPGEQLQLLNEP
jgi:hypothetical protein